jgi:hypothetical protein
LFVLIEPWCHFQENRGGRYFQNASCERARQKKLFSVAAMYFGFQCIDAIKLSASSKQVPLVKKVRKSTNSMTYNSLSFGAKDFGAGKSRVLVKYTMIVFCCIKIDPQ